MISFINFMMSMDEGVRDPHILKAVYMIGTPGAGKSTISKLLTGSSGLKSVNLDNFHEMWIKKGMIPGGQLRPEDTERSWQNVEKQKSLWKSERLGMLIDGSGRNLDGIQKTYMALDKMGYDQACVLVHIPAEEAIKRAEGRAAKQASEHGVGRSVPHDFIRSVDSQIRKNIPALRKIFGNNFIMVENMGDPRSNPEVGEASRRVTSFLNGPLRNPVAQQYLATDKDVESQNISKMRQQSRVDRSRERKAFYKESLMYIGDKFHPDLQLSPSERIYKNSPILNKIERMIFHLWELMREKNYVTDDKIRDQLDVIRMYGGEKRLYEFLRDYYGNDDEVKEFFDKYREEK